METIHPKRYLTLVIPIKQIVAGTRDLQGKDIKDNQYFSACKAKPDASQTRPSLASILPYDSDVLQYLGPEIRGRTKTSSAGNSSIEHAYLLVLRPIFIRAFDLERIPREGSASSDPRDLPAPGVVPTEKLDPSVLKLRVKLAIKGLINPAPLIPSAPICPAPVPLEEEDIVEPVVQYTSNGGLSFGISIIFAVGFYLGLMLMDVVLGYLLWQNLFIGVRVTAWEPIKVIYIGIILWCCIFWYDWTLVYFNL
jgi:hypothetical protein